MKGIGERVIVNQEAGERGGGGVGVGGRKSYKACPRSPRPQLMLTSNMQYFAWDIMIDVVM